MIIEFLSFLEETAKGQTGANVRKTSLLKSNLIILIISENLNTFNI